MNWLTPITSLFGTVAGYFTQKQEIKKVAEEAKASVAVQKQAGENEIKLTDAQWEATQAVNQKNSWKDEYITILITSPLAMLVIGSITTVFFDDTRLTDAGIEAIKALTAAGIDMEFMMEATVLAALGLKLWRKS